MTSGLERIRRGRRRAQKKPPGGRAQNQQQADDRPGGQQEQLSFLLLGLGGGLILRLGGKVVFLFSGQIIFRRLEEGRVVKVQLHLGLAEAGAQADLYFVLGRGCFEFGFVCHAFTPGRPGASCSHAWRPCMQEGLGKNSGGTTLPRLRMRRALRKNAGREHAGVSCG